MLPVGPVPVARQRLNGEGREEREERALPQPPPEKTMTTTKPPTTHSQGQTRGTLGCPSRRPD